MAEAAIGVLMLDTRFPRQPGDIGHPATFRAPVLRRVVAGAGPRRVVAQAAPLRASGLAEAFAQGAAELAAAGASVVTTSCGFLVLLQAELQAACPVPLVSSGLLLVPALLEAERRVGVLTIDAGALGPEHLAAAGVSPARLGDVVVEGVDPQGEFAQAILGNREAIDAEGAAADVLAAARRLAAREPGLRALVLECTNMPPHAAAIERATGLRTASVLDLPALRPHVDPAWTVAGRNGG